MSSTPEEHTGVTAGSSTDQQVSGLEEEGTFITDEEPSGTVPAHGSSNAGVNQTGANRVEPEQGGTTAV